MRRRATCRRAAAAALRRLLLLRSSSSSTSCVASRFPSHIRHGRRYLHHDSSSSTSLHGLKNVPRLHFSQQQQQQPTGTDAKQQQHDHDYSSTLRVFRNEFETPLRPVILRGLMDDWPAVQRWQPHTSSSSSKTDNTPHTSSSHSPHHDLTARNPLLQHYGSYHFKCGVTASGAAVETRLSDFLHQQPQQQQDQQQEPIILGQHGLLNDAPLLFDEYFGEVAPQILDDYSVPPVFSYDWLELLDQHDDEHDGQADAHLSQHNANDEQQIDERPDYRWLVIGGRGSGLSMHQDPLLTSAWNALIAGRKFWLLFPPEVQHERLFPQRLSPAGPGGAAPSAVDWLRQCWPTVQRDVSLRDRTFAVTQEPGEVLFVPSGWWHMAVSVQPLGQFSVAVTHNYAHDGILNTVAKQLEVCCPRTAMRWQRLRSTRQHVEEARVR